MNPSETSHHAELANSFEIEAMPLVNTIFRAAARTLGDPSRAEDVTQDVFLQAWKSFDRFEPGTNCRAWLFRILFYSISRHRRKWFRFAFRSESHEYVQSRLEFKPSIPEHLTDEDALAAVDRLSPDFRAVILLVDIEEFTYKEAAAILGVPVGTVMSRLSRARRKLREHLAGLAEAHGISSVVQG